MGENKTLQALYSHVIVHIRVELERKVKDLMDMEGLQCKMCDQSFKGKASLLNHIGCKHGKVRHSERERLQCATLPVGHQWEQRSRNASQPGKDQEGARQ